MSKVVLKRRKKSKVPEYTHLGCPLTKSRTLWCYKMCRPVDGLGFCGRIAPHSLSSAIQDAIRRYNEQKSA